MSRSLVSEQQVGDASPSFGRFQDRDRSGKAGSHLIIDLYGAHRLDDAAHIESTMRRCADLVGSTVLHVHLDAGAPQEGISGVAVVGGGHISIHTDPSTGYAALDFFLRGGSALAGGVAMVEKAFQASKAVAREAPRGLAEAAADRNAAALRATARSAKTRNRVRKAA